MKVKRMLANALVLLLVIAMVPFNFQANANSDWQQSGTLGDYEFGSKADAVTQPPSSMADGQVWTDKSVVANADGTFDITLSALGRQFGTEQTTSRSKYVDVVIILDGSSSMNGTKWTNAKAAARKAAEDILKAAQIEGGALSNNRVALVTYGTDASVSYSFDANSNRISGTNNRPGQVGGVNQPTQYTNTQKAIYLAEKTLTGRGALASRGGEEAAPIIILLTDGVPTVAYNRVLEKDTDYASGNRVGASSASFNENYSSMTVLQAAKAKENIEGLKIYTIGFDISAANTTEGKQQRASMNPDADNTAILTTLRPSYYTGEVRTGTATQTRSALEYQTRSKSGGTWRAWSSVQTTNTDGSWVTAWGSYSSLDRTYSQTETRPSNKTTPSNSVSWGSPLTTSAYTYRTGTGGTSSITTDENAAARRERTLTYSRQDSLVEYKWTTAQTAFDDKWAYNDGFYTSDTGIDEIIRAFEQITNSILNNNGPVETLSVADALGEGFELASDISSIAGLTNSNGVLTWNVTNLPCWSSSAWETANPGETPERPAPATVTFKVRLKSSSYAAGTFYTNLDSKAGASNPNRAVFTPVEGNPCYNTTAQQTQLLTNHGEILLSCTVLQPISIVLTKNVVSEVINYPAASASYSFALYADLSGAAIATAEITTASSDTATITIPSSYLKFGAGESSKTFYLKEQGTAPAFWTYDTTVRTVTVYKNGTYDISGNGKIFTNTYHPLGSLKVAKEWITTPDGKEEPIDIQLMVKSGDSFVNIDGRTATLDEDSGWSATFSGLELGKTYKVAEISALGDSHFLTTYSDDVVLAITDPVQQLVITNTFAQTGRVIVRKTWNDTGFEEFRPEELAFTYDGGNYSMNGTDNYVDDYTWEYVFEEQELGTHAIDETVPADYSLNGASKLSGELVYGTDLVLTLINDIDDIDFTLTLVKNWDDNLNEFGDRPASVFFTVYKGGELYGRYELSGAANAAQWTLDIEAERGTFTVEEAAGDVPVGYTEQNPGDEVTLDKDTRSGELSDTNGYDNDSGSVTVIKSWTGEAQGITIWLTKDGADYLSVEMPIAGKTGDEAWTYTFTGLELGCTYGVREEPVAGFDTTYSDEDGVALSAETREASFTVYNTSTVGELKFIKSWSHGCNPKNERPASVYIQLWRVDGIDNGDGTFSDEPVGDLVEVKGPSWSHTFEGLEAGAQYYVTEQDVPYYDGEDLTGAPATISNTETVYYRIKNTYTDPKGSVKVIKKWLGSVDPNRPASIEITLYRVGSRTPVGTKTLETSVGYVVFEGLDLNAVYYARESGAGLGDYAIDNGSPVSIGKDNQNGEITVKNTYKVPTGSVKVVKKWNKEAYPKADNPSSVTVDLYRKVGTAIDRGFRLSYTLSRQNAWSHVFSGLPLYDRDGNTYTYYVVERAVQDYTASYSAEVQLEKCKCSTITVTNTFQLPTGKLTVTKKWNYSKRDDVTVPSSVTVVLYKDGEPVENSQVELNAGNKWQHTYSGLELDRTYSVRELGESEDWSASYYPQGVKLTVNGTRCGCITVKNSYIKPVIGGEIEKTAETPKRLLIDGKAFIEYKIVVKNTGNRTLSNVKVTDVFTGKPDGSSVKYDVSDAYDFDEASGVFTIGSLKPGETVTITYSVEVDRVGEYENNATLTGEYKESKVEVSDDAEAVVEDPELGIEKSVDAASKTIGDGPVSFAYTLTVHNGGSVDLKDVTVRDTMQAGATPDYRNFTVEPVGAAVYNETEGYFEIAALASGATVIIRYTASMNAEGSYKNEATVKAVYDDRELSDKDDQTVTVNEPYDPPTPHSYTITVNYLEKGTDQVLKTRKYSSGHAEDSGYGENPAVISGYTYTGEHTGDALIGTFTKNIVITFYYTKDGEVTPPPTTEEEETLPPDDEIPLSPTPALPPEETDIDEDDIPLEDLPYTGGFPAGGMIALAGAALLGAGAALGKKK